MNKETLDFLINKGIFNIKNYINDKEDVILYKEIYMSHLILKNGWNIGCLLECYKDYNFNDLNNKKIYDNVLQSCFYNKIWNEYTLVFIKTNYDFDYKFIIHNYYK